MLPKLYLFIFTLIASASAFATPSDFYKMSSGYNPGQFEVSFFGAPSGLVERVSAAYLAAGAVKTEILNCGACPYTTIEFANDNSQAIMINPKSSGAPGGGPAGMIYQWNFALATSDDVEINTMGLGIGFTGKIAESLYLGLAKSGAKEVGQTADDKGQFTVPIYSVSTAKYAVGCQRQALKMSCYLSIK